MRTYQNFRPTQFDHHIFLPDREEWGALLGRNRDSDCLQESNFYSALHQLGGEGEDVEIHRFGHWANGWYEIILVRPATDSYTVALAIESKLANYPVLDESDWSEREAAQQVS